ncbi:hypothetical protein MPTK1_1g04910 [Marchantia polymorpha subsp. ruderalis]|uniref:Uncharacterized protein n=2 Tax=Marchantia polymorpha TaxID=3197 RepID=A0AAF6ALL3_MARPO|nr:hypothetical protein MARPO_0005s0117 [Marchantia polymorpha]BBM97333.1 hypothetical protein Mp_1g04910 [Marchantia polymorpha subsp. ruderalis]|eukprot:PTQ48474.1 hypothetical protein MARPO_0005s0117 [Marchantia polymorpha]
MCQSCAPPKLRRTYSTGLVVVQVLGKPPRPCAGAKNSSTAAAAAATAAVTSCSASSHSQRSVERPVNENRIKEEKHDRANCTKASPLRGPSWKLFAGGEQTRLADGEVSNSTSVEFDCSTESEMRSVVDLLQLFWT